MALANGALVFWVLLVILFDVCSGIEYNVGNSTGWTLGVNYDQWASAQQFQIGDIIVFKYDNQMHNVMEFTKKAYDSCNTEFPAAVHNTGSVAISVNKEEEFYFVCGMAGHCQGGMKVTIKVNTPLGPVPKRPYLLPTSNYFPSATPPALRSFNFALLTMFCVLCFVFM